MTRQRRARPLSLRERLEQSHAGQSFYAAMAGKPPPPLPEKLQQPKRQYTKRIDGSSEHKEQCAVIDWWDAACPTYGLPRFALFAVPNGAHLASGYIGAGKLKREGMRSGILDLILAVPRDQFHGLFLEMKYGDNKPSEEQKAVKSFLESQGYAAGVHWSSASAIAALEEYLS